MSPYARPAPTEKPMIAGSGDILPYVAPWYLRKDDQNKSNKPNKSD